MTRSQCARRFAIYPGRVLRLLLLKSVDQLDGREEPDPLVVMLDDLDTGCGRDMGLVRAGTADQNDVVGFVEELAAMELTHQRLVELTADEVEAVQITVGGKACRLSLVVGRADFPLGSNAGDPCSVSSPVVGHAVHLQLTRHDDDSALAVL
jgi:hypothetical protein